MNDGVNAMDAAHARVEPDPGADAVHDPTSRWERRFCLAVFAVAVAIGAALVARGEPLPALGPVLLLAVLVALSVNLGALFPSEFSATADVAILFAAVVGFAVDAPLLGPFVVGLLMGPFDWVHWKQRLFYRMAYNSGSQSLCILLAALVFRATSPALDDVVPVLVVAAIAAVIWMLADIALVTLVLVRRGGTSTLAAARHVLVLNTITVPLALVGAAAGILALEVGWGAAGLVLAPLPFVPDLVLVRARRSSVARVLAALRLPLLVTALSVVGIVADADRTTLVTLVVMGVLLGVEARPGTGSLVAPILATVVIAAVVVEGRDAYVIATLVAMGGVGATLLTAAPAFRHAVGSLVLGAGAAIASVGVYDAFDRPASSPAGMVVVAVLAGITFEVVVVTVGCPARAVALERAAWSLPVVAAAAALAVAWAALGSPSGPVVFGASLGIAMGAVAVWASPPWTSRWLARLGEHARGRRVALAVVAALAVSGAITAVVITGRGSDRLALVMVALAGAEADVAMAAAAVRQWRFAPRRRLRDAVVLVVAGGGLLAAYPALGLDGLAWSVVVLVVLLAPVIAVAWPLGRIADRAARRTPEIRNASAGAMHNRRRARADRLVHRRACRSPSATP